MEQHTHHSHNDNHEHHHHHHHHIEAANGEKIRGILIISILLNLLFVAVEAIVGLTQNSLSLLSDAGHNLSDVLSLVLVLLAIHLAKVHQTKHFTYGYKKSTVLISLLNAILLLVVVGAILAESCHKFLNPSPVNGAAVSWTAGVGIVINGLTALLLMRGQRGDLNVRGAFLHMAADTLVSVGVVISGIAISLTGWNIIDPIVSSAIAIVILVSTWGLLRDSLRLSLDGLPEGVDTDEIEAIFTSTPHVADTHHIHIWAISTTENALTAHVVVDDLANLEATKSELKHHLAEHGIGHSTLEFELPNSHCDEHHCHKNTH
ncbi:MAG: cation transporter [Bacteroidales bacterium]|nr:cation transporter [Bacteroidales bacterium]